LVLCCLVLTVKFTGKVVDVSTFRIVATTQDLSVSNMFFLSIFEEGKANADANNHYFNLTTKSDTRPTAVSEGSTSASSITRITLTSTSTTAPTLNPAETSNAPSSGSSGGLDSSAKIRIGVAIPAAAVLGAIASYLILRRRKRMAEQPPAAPAYHDENPYNDMGVVDGPRELVTGTLWFGKRDFVLGLASK
jgi:hypothetical protein